MKTQEFRIGNILEWYEPNSKFSTCEVLEIYSDDTLGLKITETFNGRYDVNYQSIKPIILSEKWLGKFGFEKTYTNISGENYVGYELNEFSICILSIEVGVYFINCKHEAPFKYVHQLQNLYFAFTGKELVITDK
jgi:hypothetical protein